MIDRYEGRFSFVVTGSVASGGMVEVPVQTEVIAARADGALSAEVDGVSADSSRARGARRSSRSARRSAARARSPTDWSRFWHLTYNIARNEFKLKFFGSALGYLWQLMRPLLLFGVLYVFFVLDLPRGQGQRRGWPLLRRAAARLDRAVHVLRGSHGGSVRSVVDRENLVRKIQFPRLVIPLSIVLLAMFNLGLNLVVVLIFALIAGVRPMLSWLELPLIVAMLTVFATGIAMLLSALFVRFRDIQPIWEVVSQILFYASPVIIPVETVREKLSAHGTRSTGPLPHLHAQSPRGRSSSSSATR